jgi:hypothetical protein
MPCQTVLRGHAHDGLARSVWVLAILIYTVSPQFQPMPLLKRPLPFDDPEWIFAVSG